MVTVHVPLLEATRGFVNASRLRLLKDNGVILNFSRAAIVDEKAVVEALDSGKLGAYICDFPTNAVKNHPKVVALPHLGASTGEAEENCAIMVADDGFGWSAMMSIATPNARIAVAASPRRT